MPRKVKRNAEGKLIDAETGAAVDDLELVPDEEDEEDDAPKDPPDGVARPPVNTGAELARKNKEIRVLKRQIAESGSGVDAGKRAAELQETIDDLNASIAALKTDHATELGRVNRDLLKITKERDAAIKDATSERNTADQDFVDRALTEAADGWSKPKRAKLLLREFVKPKRTVMPDGTIKREIEITGFPHKTKEGLAPEDLKTMAQLYAEADDGDLLKGNGEGGPTLPGGTRSGSLDKVWSKMTTAEQSAWIKVNQRSPTKEEMLAGTTA